MTPLKLYMLLLGCKPEGRHTEQHDIFFSIGSALPELVPDLQAFWPEAGKIHIDAWREVTQVDGFSIEVVEKGKDQLFTHEKLFFINLGGYKKGEFEEYHYKLLAVGKQKGEAIDQAKQTAFYKHTAFEGADSHIDDKYGVDVDDLYQIEDILPAHCKEKYMLKISPTPIDDADEWHLGYTKLSSLVKS